MNPSILIISTSPSAVSRSRIMALHCERILKENGNNVNFMDLGRDRLSMENLLAQEHELERIRQAFCNASHVVFAVPIYLYDVASTAKHLVEALSSAELGERIVGFICAAGGAHSFMSVMPFANSLMLNFRCWIVPRFVYCTPGDFVENEPANFLVERLVLLCRDLISVRPGPTVATATMFGTLGNNQVSTVVRGQDEPKANTENNKGVWQ